MDVVHDGWLRGELQGSYAVDWLEGLREKLALIWEVAIDKELVAKRKMVERTDRTAKVRNFSPGDQVLVRVVDSGGKLGDKWEGPFEIVGKVAEVTYRVSVPHRRGKSMIAHINRLKAWNAPDASILRIIVADEEEEVDVDNTLEWKTLLSPKQQSEIEQLLEEFVDRLDGTLGTCCMQLRLTTTSLCGHTLTGLHLLGRIL